jgi:hypothetical protein
VWRTAERGERRGEGRVDSRAGEEGLGIVLIVRRRGRRLRKV